MKTYVATKNQGKLLEIRTMFAGSALALETYAAYADPDEGETSYVENALLKARALREQLCAAGISGAAVLADDSGIEIDAFGGAPGVLSARYAGESTSWPDRRAFLLHELDGVAAAGRGARFVCVMALILPDGNEIAVRGDVDGRIAEHERGDQGFGYDPVFYYPPIGCTFAEIPEREKNELSHRGRAARALLQALESR